MRDFIGSVVLCVLVVIAVNVWLAPPVESVLEMKMDVLERIGK